MTAQVLQVIPAENYKVYLYFSDGRVKVYDASHLVGKGVFKKLEYKDFYFNRCTVLNGTLAWDVTGDFNPRECIDLDPDTLYIESIEVPDPLATIA
jgi:hypothetical protein